MSMGRGSTAFESGRKANGANPPSLAATAGGKNQQQRQHAAAETGRRAGRAVSAAWLCTIVTEYVCSEI
jgi:hypothetical protein